MKLLKRLSLVFVVLFILSSVGGCFYFKKKFSPPANQLHMANQAHYIPFVWRGDANDTHAFLLVPVTLPGSSKKFYMQLDTGAPYSLFYQSKVEALQKKYGNYGLHQKENGTFLEDLKFNVGDLTVTASEIKVLANGTTGINWEDTTQVEVIGTLGSDFIENKVVAIDYSKGVIFWGDQLPKEIPASTPMLDFEFENRRVMLPSTINGKETKLMFDTGASAYELLTNQSTWKELADQGSRTDTTKVNSWGTTLTAFTVNTSKTATFGQTQIPIKQATYMEGMSFINTTLMRFSGMGGMTGNKLFLGTTLVLDTKHQKFAIVANR
ncbi:hypothetical protein GU926_09400 [Nibribacter ruber]|uniref:Peptidase A2 domain-containing protein n=1 Tax=Nibribacter ruber TaxID=2698458 RepID=A0A6P1NX92_9BACT|nr:hypothetical protein [Nibribacter ruber]QHL87640.1 hypothetical protein GU926_09400 [Nibribacter ruber]